MNQLYSSFFRIENHPKVECHVNFEKEYFKLSIKSDNKFELNEITITYYKQTFVIENYEMHSGTSLHYAEISLEKFDRHVFEREYSAKICYSMIMSGQTIEISDVYDFEVSFFTLF
jgi:hypothetical protein